LWIHDAVGLYVTPLALAIAYFRNPVAADGPFTAMFLSMIGFWLLFFAYPLNGTHHYVFSSIPMTHRRPPSGLGVSGHGCSPGRHESPIVFTRNAGKVRQDTPLLFVWTGVVIYLVVSLQGSLQALMPVNSVRPLHRLVIGHSHLAMLGFAGLIAAGGVAHFGNTLRATLFRASDPVELLVTHVRPCSDGGGPDACGAGRGALLADRSSLTASIVAVRKYWVASVISAVPHCPGICLFLLRNFTGPLNEEGEAREQEQKKPLR